MEAEFLLQITEPDTTMNNKRKEDDNNNTRDADDDDENFSDEENVQDLKAEEYASSRYARSWRRPSSFFTIGEENDSDNYNEFDSDNENITGLRKNSTAYSSTSSLDSDAELGWEFVNWRRNRRESVAPMHPGLQTWVESKFVEDHEQLAQSKQTGADTKKKRLPYEEMKELINCGKIKEAKLAVRENDWDFKDIIRSRLWPLLDSIHESDRTSLDGFYWESVEQIYGNRDIPESPDAVSLPGFVEPNFKLYFGLSDEGKIICNRLVSVVGFAYPAITYCPVLLPVASLLLHYVPEEKAYNNICVLLSARHKVFLTQTKLQWEVTYKTAMQLVKKFSKSTYAFLLKNLEPGQKMESLFQGWIWWIFRDLPLTHLIRVMDCFLMEGMKVLYRVTIAILLSFTKAASSDSTWSKYLEESGCENAISKFCRDIATTLAPQRLLKSAFSIRAFRSTEIRKIRTKLELTLKSRGLTGNGMHKSKSNENIPTSQSQADIQMMSHTLTIKELLALWQWMPIRITMYQPELLYTTEEHGCSLTTFFNRVENYEPTILIIKTTTNEIFGAYCSAPWSTRNSKDERGERTRYFGTGETFLFSLAPKRMKYPWVGIQPKKVLQQSNTDSNIDAGDIEAGKKKNDHTTELFMHADTHMITIGGGQGQGIYIDQDLRFGKSERCHTFDNPPLVENRDFEISCLEVVGFTGM